MLILVLALLHYRCPAPNRLCLFSDLVFPDKASGTRIFLLNKKCKATQEYMGVSKNRGTPKSPILTGFSMTNHPFWVPLFSETPIWNMKDSGRKA